MYFDNLSLPLEVWKTWLFDDILLRHCNAVYNQNPIDRWMKGCIVSFPKKGDLGLAKDYWGITLTSIAAKIYKALLPNHIKPKIENIGRTKIASEGIDPRRHIFWLSVVFLKVYVQKPRGNNIICRLYQGLWVHSQRKDGAILLAYGLPKETVAAIMML